MRIGWVGLGKLGLPCALALAEYGGHQVHGYDTSPAPATALDTGRWPHAEQGLGRLLTHHPRFHLRGSLRLVVDDADVVFVAVQTPHARGYDGSAPTHNAPATSSTGTWSRPSATSPRRPRAVPGR